MSRDSYRFSALLASLLVGSCLVASCGGSGSGNRSGVSPPPPPVPPSAIATLSDLSLSAGPISPVFQSDTNDYSLAVANGVAATSVTATATDARASITINGTGVASGAGFDVPLNSRATAIAIIVTAEDGTTAVSYTVTVNRAFASFELLDPTPGASDEFGSEVTIVGGGNVVVNDPFDSSSVLDGGAVHLFDPLGQTLIASIYGDQPGDRLGDDSITALGDGNFVIVSRFDDDGGPQDTGAVRLVDSQTGAQIGPTATGNERDDFLGGGGITVLPNNNYLIRSPLDDVAGMQNAGSVRLMNGNTGQQIAVLAGDQPMQFLGNGGVVALENGNYVVASFLEDNGPTTDVGAIRLMDGATGAQIGVTLYGDLVDDQLGRTGITPLASGNFVIGSDLVDNGALVDAGSIALIDGTTGLQIGVTVYGEQAIQNLSFEPVTALGNGNFVVVSSGFSAPGVPDAGSVRLFDGVTGEQIGPAIIGDQPFDFVGGGGITALVNDNFVIASNFADSGLTQNAGSVQLISGATGMQIGMTVFGGQKDDLLGAGGVIALTNGNYVVETPDSDGPGPGQNAGLVQLFDGVSGMVISSLAGAQADDQIGFTGATPLNNGNYVLASLFEDVGAIDKAGVIRVFNGVTGDQIGATITGDETEDLLGDRVFALADDSYVIVSILDDDGMNQDVGSIRRGDSTSGLEIGSPTFGSSALDLLEVRFAQPTDGGYFIIGAPEWDNGGMADSGLVRLFAL